MSIIKNCWVMNFPVIVLTVLFLPFHNTVAKNEPEKKITVSSGNTSVIRPGQNVIAVYIDSITNSSPEDIALINVTSSLAQKVEIHSMRIVENRMKMTLEEKIIIPALSKTSLRKGNPNGYHLMLLNISPEIKKRTMLPLTLSFSNGQNILCTVTVKKHSDNK